MSKRTSPRVGFFALSAAVLALGLLPALAGASVLLDEPFNYSDGQLDGNGTWTQFSGTAGQILVISGEAQLLQSTQSEDAAVTFAQRGATDKTYMSFALRVVAAPSLSSPTYFAMFKVPSTNFYVARVYIAPPTGGGDYTLGLSGTSTMEVNWASDFTFGSTHYVVVQYDASDGSAKMWVDPTKNENSLSILSTNGFSGDLIGEVALREASGPVSEERIDNLRVGTLFADVYPPPAPSLSQWGMMMLALGLIGLGGLYVARRRRALA